MLWRSRSMQLTSTILALFVAAAAVIVGVVYWQTQSLLSRQTITFVNAEVRNLSELAARNGQSALLNAIKTRERPEGGFRYALADSQGRTLWIGQLGDWPKDLNRDNATTFFDYSVRSSTRLSLSRDQMANSVRAIGATVLLPSGGRLLVARDISQSELLASTMRWWFLVGLSVLVVLALFAGWAIHALLRARVATITAAADRIMAGDLSQRIPVAFSNEPSPSASHSDEFDALAEHLNRMLERIESLMDGLREVSDNIAHDLKTPLNRMRIHVETVLRDAQSTYEHRAGLETVLIETDELIRTFNALLRVARLEAGTLGENVETFDIAAMLRDLGEFYEPVIDEAGAKLSIDADAAVILRGDRQLISQALTNLLENALKYGIAQPPEATGGPSCAKTTHTVSSASATISLGVSSNAQGAALWVADNGRGIPSNDTARVLERFVRLDAARTKPGTGLGLSLVAAVARQHGGAFKLEDNHPGLRAVLQMPVARVVTERRCHASQEQEAGTLSVQSVSPNVDNSPPYARAHKPVAPARSKNVADA